MTLFSVQAVLILSTEDGSRIFSKYYTSPHNAPNGKLPPSSANVHSQSMGTNIQSSLLAGQATSSYPDVKSQKTFEKGLIDKTSKQTGDIILYDNRIVLYKLESDVMIYVVGSVDENEILLYNTILALRDSLHLLFKCVTFCGCLGAVSRVLIWPLA